MIQEDLNGKKFKVLESQKKQHQVKVLITSFPKVQTTPQTEFERRRYGQSKLQLTESKVNVDVIISTIGVIIIHGAA
jgi:hypothetical protein